MKLGACPARSFVSDTADAVKSSSSALLFSTTVCLEASCSADMSAFRGKQPVSEEFKNCGSAAKPAQPCAAKLSMKITVNTV